MNGMNQLICLMLLLFNSQVFALTITSDGADGLFIPSISTILAVPDNGIFNFSEIYIGPDINISFDRNGYEDTIWLASVSDVSILGDVSWTGGLGISTLTDINLFNGSNLSGDELRLEASGVASVYSGENNLSIINAGGNSSNSGGVTLTAGGSVTIGASGGINGYAEITEITLTGLVNLTTTVVHGGNILTVAPAVVPLPLPLLLFVSALGMLVPRIRIRGK